MLGNYMEIRVPIKYCIALLFIINSAACAQQSPYFPRSGADAIAQAVREIGNPSVYLIVAAGPGFEDLASIANFRIGGGAIVAVAYVTNGEDIPSDFNGEMFYQLASRRKEEGIPCPFLPRRTGIFFSIFRPAIFLPEAIVFIRRPGLPQC